MKSVANIDFPVVICHVSTHFYGKFLNICFLSCTDRASEILLFSPLSSNMLDSCANISPSHHQHQVFLLYAVVLNGAWHG